MKQTSLPFTISRFMIICLVVLLSIPLTASAQKVTLSLKGATIQQAILALKGQGYSFSVKADDVNMNAQISLNARNEELQSVVDKIFEGQNVNCQINGKTILVTKIEKQPQYNSSKIVRVTGCVTDHKGAPLVGVTIWVDGTSSGTNSSTDGKYTIDARSGEKLVFSYIGYQEHKEVVGTRTKIDVTLKEAATAMDEVVVVGYGTQSRRTLTTSISKIDGADLFDAPVSTIGDALKGKVPGLRVATNNNVSGESPRFLIRGGSSINLSNDPITIVDGVTRSMDDINPNDIESIEILKDAASAGIYGARASNGVILVTTKKGNSSRRPEIIFDTQLGFTSPARKWDLMNSREFITKVRTAIDEFVDGAKFGKATKESILNGETAAGTGNTKSNSLFTTQYLEDGASIPSGWQSMADPLNPDKTLIFTNTDYQSQWFSNAFWHKEYIGVNGGSDKIKYAASVSYLGDDGMIAMNRYRIFTMHGNTSFNITKNLVASTTFDLSRSKQNRLLDDTFASIGRSIMTGPTHRNYDENGDWITGGTNKNQQIASFWENFYDREGESLNMTGNFNLKWTITKGLTATAQYALMNSNYRGSYYEHGQIGGTPNFRSSTRSTTETRTQTIRDSFTAYLNYNRTFADAHTINITGGYDYMKQRYWYLTANATGSVSDKVPIIDSGINFTASNKDEEQALISYFGRIQYDYKNRYIVAGTFRADGSSKFAKGNQWGYFPAGSLAWNIAEEPFWNISKSKMSTFKIRASYGQTGNNGIGLYDTYGAYSTSVYAGHSILLPSTMQNANLKWETTTQLDLGIDASWFHDRLRFVFDYYNKLTDNMLFSITLPDTGPLGSVKANIGSAKFYGFEIELHSVNIQKKNFTWTTDITYSYNKNKVKSLPNEYKYTDINGKTAWRIGGYQMSESGYKFGGTAVGEPLGRIYGYKYSHILETQEQVDAALYDSQSHGMRRSDGKTILGRKDIGDWEWCNRQGSALLPDGSEQINAEDMYELGNVMPHSVGGINNTFKYKGLTINIYLDFALGHSIYNYMKTRFFQCGLGNMNSNVDKLVNDCWRYPGDKNAKFARFFPNDPDFGSRNFSRASQFNVEKADYLCLRDVSIYYDLPQRWTRKLGIKKITVGVTGNTLCYWTGVTGGISPETGMGTGSSDSMYTSVNNGNANGTLVPPQRKVLFNVKVTF